MQWWPWHAQGVTYFQLDRPCTGKDNRAGFDNWNLQKRAFIFIANISCKTLCKSSHYSYIVRICMCQKKTHVRRNQKKIFSFNKWNRVINIVFKNCSFFPFNFLQPSLHFIVHQRFTDLTQCWTDFQSQWIMNEDSFRVNIAKLN